MVLWYVASSSGPSDLPEVQSPGTAIIIPVNLNHWHKDSDEGIFRRAGFKLSTPGIDDSARRNHSDQSGYIILSQPRGFTKQFSAADPARGQWSDEAFSMANRLYILAIVIAMPVEFVSCVVSKESSSLATGPSPHFPQNRIVCSRAIPSLKPLHDAHFESIASMTRAPAIAPGEEVTRDHLRNAEEEVQVRKKFRLSWCGASESEVSDAEARLHTVTQEWTKSLYPYTTPPPTGSEHFSNLFHDLNSRIEKANQDAAADRQAAAAAAAAATAAATAAAEAAAADRLAAAADRRAIRELIVKSDNQFIRARNRQALIDSAAHGGGQQPLFPLLKERDGAGVALPGQGYMVAAQPAMVGLGVAVGAAFPATVRHLNELTMANLSTLAILYNDHFGIVPTDSLSERRAKFQAYIVGL